ncbi:MAG: hypothetical protein MK213_00170, partial [Planctomycetes bacterium]|nr:hypothetical protein [Planctomycetota bacterium]
MAILPLFAQEGERVLPFEVKGRLHFDVGSAHEDSSSSRESGRFRRMRMGFKGQVMPELTWAVDWEFTAQVELQKAYLRWTSGSGSTWTLGRTREPLGMEKASSSRFYSFLETGGAAAFSPGRNVGLRWGHSFPQDLLLVMVSPGHQEFSAWDGGDRSATVKWLHRPVADPTNGRVVHWGAAASRRSQLHDADALFTGGTSFLEQGISVGTLPTGARLHLLSLEAAWVEGAWAGHVEGVGLREVHGWMEDALGWNMEVTRFLDDRAHRGYDLATGGFHRASIPEGGAWQWMARWGGVAMENGSLQSAT